MTTSLYYVPIVSRATTLGAVVETFSDGTVGDVIDSNDGRKQLFEFLSAVVYPACYGGEYDLKQRLKNNPTKTFLDIAEPSEIALCLCVVNFCRKSWVHDREIKEHPKDEREKYKIRNQGNMTPNTKEKYTKVKPIHVGQHRTFLDPSWSDEGLEIFFGLVQGIEVSSVGS